MPSPSNYPAQISLRAFPSPCLVSPPISGMRCLEGAGGHKCSSSALPPLILALESFLPHAGYSGLQSPGFAAMPLKHELNLSRGIRFDSYTHAGHTASPWPHYEKVSQSLRPAGWLLCFSSPSWGSWGHTMWVPGGNECLFDAQLLPLVEELRSHIRWCITPN